MTLINLTMCEDDGVREKKGTFHLAGGRCSISATIGRALYVGFDKFDIHVYFQHSRIKERGSRVLLAFTACGSRCGGTSTKASSGAKCHARMDLSGSAGALGHGTQVSINEAFLGMRILDGGGVRAFANSDGAYIEFASAWFVPTVAGRMDLEAADHQLTSYPGLTDILARPTEVSMVVVLVAFVATAIKLFAFEMRS